MSGWQRERGVRREGGLDPTASFHLRLAPKPSWGFERFHIGLLRLFIFGKNVVLTASVPPGSLKGILKSGETAA